MTAGQRRTYFFLQVFVVFTALSEVMSVATIGPFIALVGDISLVEKNSLVNSLYLQSGLSTPMEFLFATGACVLFLLFFSAIISIFTIWRLSYFAARTGAEIGDALYEYYMNQSFLYHSQTSSSLLIKQISTEVGRITDHIFQPFVQINARVVAAIFLSIAIFVYNPVISIAGLLMFTVCYYLLFIAVRGRLARNGTAISQVSRKRFLLMNEGFGAVREIQLLGRQSDFIYEFKKSGEVFSEAYGSSNGLYNMPRYFMEFIIYSGMIGLILFLVKLYSGDLSEVLPVLAVFGIAAFKLLPFFQQIYSSTAQIKTNISAFKAIENDILKFRELNNVSPGNFTKLLLGAVKINNVFFRYPEKNTNSLDGISLEIPQGKIIGIVGPSGSGKSTLLDVLLGLIEPDNGCLIVSGETIEKHNIRSWQDKIGYVPQNIFLKEASIIENIAFGLDKGSINMEKVHAAVRLVHLEEWVSVLPEGLMTNVGERGVQLSGGQRQRIGIARALYNDVDYLFFDEATNALDGITENLIMEEIESLSHNKTIVMIAHRLNTVRNCDFIYMISSGRVVDQGDYDYLLKNNVEFQKMTNSK